MKYGIRWVILGLYLWPAISGAVLVDGVAAYANTHVITFSDVLGTSRDLQQMLAQRRGGDEVNATYRLVLDELINRKLIMDAYEEQKEIRIPEEMIKERVEEVIRDMFGNDRVAFLRALSADGQSEQAWREHIREQMTVAAMRNLQVDSQVRVSPLAVRTRYELAPERYEKPARVNFSMIVIGKGDGAGRLQEALAALEQGEPFGAVARRYSEDVRAVEGGARGWIESNMLRDDLRDVVMRIEPGQVSEVIDIGANHALVRVEAREEPVGMRFEDVYADIERELRLELSRDIYEEWVARLRRDAFVRVLNEAPF